MMLWDGKKIENSSTYFYSVKGLQGKVLLLFLPFSVLYFKSKPVMGLSPSRLLIQKRENELYVTSLSCSTGGSGGTG